MIIFTKKGPTMEILRGLEKFDVQYVVIKVGDKIFSTDHSIKTPYITHAQRQIVDTENIGIQENFYFRGVVEETNDYKKIDPMRFSLDIYTKTDLKMPAVKKF